MFKAYYGLSCNPFDKHSLRVKDHFVSADFKEMSARLSYLKDIRGIGAFTANPGMGKSFALRCFADSLPQNLFYVKYICLSTISVAEFYKTFCEQLGLEVKGSKTSMFRAIQERVYYLYKEKRQPLILIIDEAQYLNDGIFKDLKMIMNHGFDSLNCFTLILCGEPRLNHLLEKPIHEALKQRITVHYHFQGLSNQELGDYIRHKLSLAGGTDALLGDGVISAIHGFSQGNPRLIDNLMTDALTLGAQLDRKVLDTEIIMAAVNNQSLY
jgi:type II secretory pathway predicted ATPase ExeA